MDCRIQWELYSRQEWQDILNRCSHSTLLQTYYYAQTMREVKQQNVRHGLIIIDGAEAGCVQMQEVSLFGKLIHAISIDRGPLWFDGFGKINDLKAFATELNHQFPLRIGRKRRFMPEYSAKNHEISFENFKKYQKEAVYKTYLVDISQNLDKVRENLKKNWRNMLSKAEKQNLSVEIDDKLSTLAYFLKFYTQDRFQKGYAGASAKFLASLAKFAAINRECLILNATEDGETIASILIFCHGRGATYQAGWTTPYGRDKSAHHLLLWEAIKMMKDKGITAFDLGGFNDETGGIKNFKQGLGGQEIALIGSYS